MRIISIDVETDGLWGNPFAIGAILYVNGVEIEKVAYRLPDTFVSNQWVQENVLPALEKPTCPNNIGSCKKGKKYAPNSWGSNPSGYYEAMCQACRSHNMEVTHDNYESMMKDFASWYLGAKKDATVLWHMGHVVEAFLFRELHRLGFIGDWDAPYCPIEVSSYLEQVGEPADSVDSYAKKYSLQINDYGSTHNPLYDAEVAAKCYFHILASSYKETK